MNVLTELQLRLSLIYMTGGIPMEKMEKKGLFGESVIMGSMKKDFLALSSFLVIR